MAAVALALVAGCDRGQPTETAPSGRAVINCSSARGLAGGVIDTATWLPSRGPYCINSTVLVVKRLTIEAGTLVYAAAGAGFELDSGAVFLVRGTRANPVVLTARDTVAGWAGLTGVGPHGRCSDENDYVVTLLHTQFEHARRLQGEWVSPAALELTGARLQMDSSWLRGGGGVALCRISGWIRGSTLDTAGVTTTFGDFTIERTVMRGAGIFCGRQVALHLRSVRIEGVPQAAISFYESTPCTLAEATGVRLVGNGSIAFLSASAAQMLVTEPDAADSLAGNLQDVVTLHTTYAADMRVDGEIALPGFEYRAPSLYFHGKGLLRLAPGTRLRTGTLAVDSGIRVVAGGTPKRPITFSTDPCTGVWEVGGWPGAPSCLANVRVEGEVLRASLGRPLYLDSARVVHGSVELRAAGSRITASVVDSADAAYVRSTPAITLGESDTVRTTIVRRSRSVGLRIEGAAVVDSCEVTGSAGDGIVVSHAAGTTIHRCNLHDNAGVGVRNLDTATVDARFNWWGDPAGPNGPAGDGVAGLVDWSGWLGAPAVLALLDRLAFLP